jgi:hypothetical protein
LNNTHPASRTTGMMARRCSNQPRVARTARSKNFAGRDFGLPPHLSSARPFSDYLFAELPHGRRREVLEALCEAASFQPGDRVKTLRGSSRGIIIRLLADGRVVWRPDGTGSELAVEDLLPRPEIQFAFCDDRASGRWAVGGGDGLR